jgi:single-stranded DNA-specific DHH superfamily exonuclease
MDLTASISENLIHFGGHEAAGGFAFVDGRQEEIEKLLNQNYKDLFLNNVESNNKEDKNNSKKINNKDEEVSKKESKENGERNIRSESNSEIKFDYEYRGEDLYKLYLEQEKLSPFGMGNLAPVFKLVGESSVREFGDNNKHIEVSVKIIEGNNLGQIQIIKWNADKNIKDKVRNSKIFYANLEKDNWKNGYKFMLVDCE